MSEVRQGWKGKGGKERRERRVSEVRQGWKGKEEEKGEEGE